MSQSGHRPSTRYVSSRPHPLHAVPSVVGAGSGLVGVGGGIVAVAPGHGAICVWSPGLNAAGTSLAGAMALEKLVERTGWSVFA